MTLYNNVLIVDDDQIYNKLIQQKLKKMNIASHVISLDNGKKAFDFINQEKDFPIDMMIVDINMPVMGGYDLLSKIEKFKSDTRLNVILVASNTVTADDKQRFMDLNCVSNVIEKSMVVDYLKKINDDNES